MQLGDARTGKWPINLLGFARALRRSGVPMDSAKIALSLQAAMAVGLENKADLQTALSCVLISRLEDRAVFQELFDAYFKDPKVANQLLAQMLPSTEGQAQANKRKPRVNEALNPKRGQAPGRALDHGWIGHGRESRVGGGLAVAQAPLQNLVLAQPIASI